MIMVAIYTNLGVTPLALVIAINVLMFAGVMARMSTSSALISAIPQPQDRGAFMSVNYATQQFAGGLAAFVAGHVIYEGADGKLHNYSALGIIVMSSMVVVMVMLYFVNRQSARKAAAVPPVKAKQVEAEAFVIE
jgi:MFS family permease